MSKNKVGPLHTEKGDPTPQIDRPSDPVVASSLFDLYKIYFIVAGIGIIVAVSVVALIVGLAVGTRTLPTTTTTVTTTTTTSATTTTTTSATTTTSTTTTSTSATTSTATTVTERLEGTTNQVCFNGNSTVMKSDGTEVFMRNLNLADKILTVKQSSDGKMKLGYSQLLALDIYQKWDTNSLIDYLEIHTGDKDNEDPLYITPRHSLLVRKQSQSLGEYLFASEVEIGDYLYRTSDDYQSVIEVPISRINKVKEYDAYAPLTFEENLIVNKKVVSCYGTFSHSIGHLLKMPRRYSLHFYLNWYIILIWKMKES